MASSPPPDQHKPSSMLSPSPFMSFNNPFPGLLPQELENPTAIVSLKSVSFGPQPMSSQASMGGSATKVSKRRSKSATKPPIKVLSADRCNFRDMVHKLTGIPTSPSYMQQGNGFQQPWANNSSASIKSMATGPNSPHDDDTAAGAHGLRSLETSSAYFLLNGASQKADEVHSNSDFSFLQSLQHPQPHYMGGVGFVNTAFYNQERSYYNPSSSNGGGGGLDLKSSFASQFDPSKCIVTESGRELVSPNMLLMEHLHRIRQSGGQQ